jgi:hypothetical protein
LTAEAHEDRQTPDARLGVDEPRLGEEAAPVASSQIRAETGQAQEAPDAPDQRRSSEASKAG